MSPTTASNWSSRHSRLIDGITIAVIFAYSGSHITTFLEHAEQAVVFGLLGVSVFLCVPYLFRRAHPVAAFGVMFAAACVQVLFDAGLLVADVTLVFAVFSLAARFPWTQSGWSVVAVLLWLPVAAMPYVDDGYLGVGAMVQFMIGVLLVWLAGTLQRARRELVASLRDRARELERQRDAQARISAAEERARIAREIHDIVSHSLGTMVVMADAASRTVETAPVEAGRAMARVRDTGRAAMTEMRRMLDVLRDDDTASRVPQPGLAGLDRLVDELRATGLRVDVAVVGDPVALPAGMDLAAYRIIQEALTNARRHGGTLLSIVDVAVHYHEDAVELRVRDDGQNPPEDPWTGGKGGHGLIGMRERITAYGGTLHAGPRLRGGFDVRAVLPIEGDR
ncbi:MULTISPECIES: sensor histidine kinase [Actinoalloteichus]|uniref:sensor histidine kinase n=1 Tax=Actinoalloteichus TaxID=65496 RepID=UPI0018DE641C|nr:MULTISPECIES: histidine kinase [Actinoalloteichus]